MKKIIIAVALLAAVLLCGPWLIGRFAERSLNTLLDQLVAQTPYLQVVERSWQGGWFTSRQQVTLQSTLPLGDEAQPRFTLHNDVLHGPVLGLSGIGIARVGTRIDLPPQAAARMREVFGPEPSLQVDTRVGFTGGGSTVIRSAGRTVNLPNGGGEIEYESARIEIDFSRNVDAYELQGRLPRLEMRGSDGGLMVLDRLTMEGEAERIVGELYATDFEMRLRELQVAGSGTAYRVEDLHYDTDMDEAGGYVAIGVEIGTGEVGTAQAQALGFDIEAVDYDFTLQHLHAETLAGLMNWTRDLYRALPSAADAGDPQSVNSEIVLAPMREAAGRLLQHGPQLVLDRVGLRTSVGEAVLTGTLQVPGVTAQDLDAGLAGAMSRLQADLLFEIEQPLAERIPNGATIVAASVDSGYFTRDGERLVARIGYRNGTLTINDMPMAVPFLGAPAASGMEPVPGAESP